MGSSDGGHALEAVRLADVAKKWRVPEFVALGLLVGAVMLIEASVPEYEQFIPPVSSKCKLNSTWYLVIVILSWYLGSRLYLRSSIPYNTWYVSYERVHV